MGGLRLAALSLVFLMAAVAPAAEAAIALNDCYYRVLHILDAGPFVVVHCTFASDLYLKSTINSTLPPLKASLSKAEIEAAIAGSVPSFANWKGRYNLGDSTVPAYVVTWTGNLRLECGGVSVPQGAEHDYPLDFLYTLPPTRNSLNELLQAMGAFKWPEPILENTVSFAMAVSSKVGPTAIPNVKALNDCAAAGTLRVVWDQDSSYPGWDDRNPRNSSLWKFVDASGARATPGSGVAVTKRLLTCDVEAFKTFAETRMTEIVNMLEVADSRDSSESALNTYDNFRNHETFMACSIVLDALFKKETREISLKGVRACSDNNPSDPCCSESLRWSDCCVPGDKIVNVSGLFGGANEQEITSRCGASNVQTVLGLLQSFKEVLVAAQHPETGCEAAAKERTDDRLWEQLSAPIKECGRLVEDGKSTQDTDTCNGDSECWTESCVSEGDSSRCAAARGSTATEPILRCVLSNADRELWDYLALSLDIDSSKVPSLGDGTKSWSDVDETEWDTAVTSFRDKVGVPSCAGEYQDTNMWCTVALTKSECKSIQAGGYSVGWHKMVVWIDNGATSDPNDGWCKHWAGHIDRGGANAQTGDVAHVNDHMSDAENLEQCKAIFTAVNYICSNSQHASYNDCTGAKVITGGQLNLCFDWFSCRVLLLWTAEQCW
mmetsp:Transcript_31217/g.72984  ORF Transcript_31217/g.72984 Transcript_31217/m.72984 type:complete len:664 (-) Transcript_31217:283-2274(-)